MEQEEMEGGGWPDDWFMMPWDDEDYEPSEQKMWERVAWVEDIAVPLDTYLKDQ